MIETIVGIGILTLGLASLAFLGIFLVRKWGIPTAKLALEAYWEGRWGEVDQRLSDLESDVAALPRTWKEFSDESRKQQNRARWHVRRVKQELEERGLQSEEINEISDSLRATDGEGSEEQGVLPMYENLAEVSPPSPDPMNAVLHRKWGKM